MAAGDYAIVVGITKYPGLGLSPNETADLKGAERDALEIASWLKAKDGGDLPDDRDHINLICTSEFQDEPTATKGEPQQQRLRDAFEALVQAGKEKPRASRDDPMLGRRLYIYMSGHGFSPSRYRGALYVANATPDNGWHSYASGWLEWFQDNFYFKEYVLWMDCCMDREFGIDPENIMKKTARFGRMGGTFIAFAAPRQFKTVERPIKAKDGEIHGVFTWALLEGLKGCAVDSEGQITGRSLADYLLNGMSAYLTEDDLKNPTVAREPEVVKADRTLIFATGRQKQSSSVTLAFPADAVGKQATLWGGLPAISHSFPVQLRVSRQLENGLYVVAVPELHLRHGFEVTGPQSPLVEVSGKGAPVAPAGPDDHFVLTINPHQPTAEIFLIDQALRKQAQSRRILTAGFPFGVYKLKIRVGHTVTESIILLDQDLDFSTVQGDRAGPPALADPLAMLSVSSAAVTSAAPLPGTGLTHEVHWGVLEAWKIRARQPGGSQPDNPPPAAEIRLLGRVWSGQQAISRQVRPWQGTELLDSADQVIRALKDLPEQFADGDPYVEDQVPVEPGTYFVRYPHERDRTLAGALTVPEGWTVELFLLALPAGETGAGIRFNRMTVLMRRVGDSQRDVAFEQTLESARIAMVNERRILNRELEEILVRNFHNPIAGILGGHLLLQEERRRPNPSSKLGLLDGVVANLRTLVGDEHPDVEALSLYCPTTSLRATKPFQQPPLFVRSWELIVEASQTQPELLPFELWERVRAVIPVSGYFVWGCDEKSKRARTQQLKSWLQTASQQVAKADDSNDRFDVAIASVGGAASLPVPDSAAADPNRGKMISAFARQLRVPSRAVASLLGEASSLDK
jgi:Caspase domain